MVASTSVPVLTWIALALSWVAISSNSALSSVLSDEGFPEPNGEGGALRRGFVPRELRN